MRPHFFISAVIANFKLVYWVKYAIFRVRMYLCLCLCASENQALVIVKKKLVGLTLSSRHSAEWSGKGSAELSIYRKKTFLPYSVHYD